MKLISTNFLITLWIFIFSLTTFCALHDHENIAVRGNIYLESFFYVSIDADEKIIKKNISKQLQFLFSAMRNHKLFPKTIEADHKKISWNHKNYFVRTQKNSKHFYALKKIIYRYQDQAVAHRDVKNFSTNITLLRPDYEQYQTNLMSHCADEKSVLPETLWYFFDAHRLSCKNLIAQEKKYIIAKNAKIKRAGVISYAEAKRKFVPAKIYFNKSDNKKSHPDYQRLFRLKKSPLIIYFITSADASVKAINDRFGMEYMRFLKKIFEYYPTLTRVKTTPFVNVQEIIIDQKNLAGISDHDLFSWLADDKNYPTSIGDDRKKILDLKAQAMDKFAMRVIHWKISLPTTDIELRSFYGHENGSKEVRENFINHLREAFSQGDVVIYNGHSHLGFAAINPKNFSHNDFLHDYQLLFLNSCSSYSFFSAGFKKIKKDMDIVSNASSSPINNSGNVAAQFVHKILSQENFFDLISSMDTNTSTHTTIRVIPE